MPDAKALRVDGGARRDRGARPAARDSTDPPPASRPLQARRRPPRIPPRSCAGSCPRRARRPTSRPRPPSPRHRPRLSRERRSRVHAKAQEAIQAMQGPAVVSEQPAGDATDGAARAPRGAGDRAPGEVRRLGAVGALPASPQQRRAGDARGLRLARRARAAGPATATGAAHAARGAVPRRRSHRRRRRGARSRRHRRRHGRRLGHRRAHRVGGVTRGPPARDHGLRAADAAAARGRSGVVQPAGRADPCWTPAPTTTSPR